MQLKSPPPLKSAAALWNVSGQLYSFYSTVNSVQSDEKHLITVKKLMFTRDAISLFRGAYRGEVDATCVQIGLRGRELHTDGGRIPPDIWVISNL